MYLAQRFPDRPAGSNAEPLTVQFVLYGYGAAQDLTDATVTFRMADAVTGVVIAADRPAQGASNGVASYGPTLAEVALPGEYTCQFTAVLPDGTVQRSEPAFLRLVSNP